MSGAFSFLNLPVLQPLTNGSDCNRHFPANPVRSSSQLAGVVGIVCNGILVAFVGFMSLRLLISWVATAAWCTKGRYVDLQGSSEFERRRSAYIRLAFHLLLLLSAALQLPQQIDHVRFGVDTRLGFALHMLADEFFLVSVSLVVLQWALLSTEVLGQKKRGHVYTVCVCVPNAVLLMYVVGMMCVLLVPSTGANDGSLANACTAKFECECNGFLDFVAHLPYKFYEVIVNVFQQVFVILLFVFGMRIVFTLHLLNNFTNAPGYTGAYSSRAGSVAFSRSTAGSMASTTSRRSSAHNNTAAHARSASGASGGGPGHASGRSSRFDDSFSDVDMDGGDQDSSFDNDRGSFSDNLHGERLKRGSGAGGSRGGSAFDLNLLREDDSGEGGASTGEMQHLGIAMKDLGERLRANTLFSFCCGSRAQIKLNSAMVVCALCFALHFFMSLLAVYQGPSDNIWLPLMLWYTLDYWLPTIPPTFLMVLLMRNVQQRREKRGASVLRPGGVGVGMSAGLRASSAGSDYLGSSWHEQPEIEQQLPVYVSEKEKTPTREVRGGGGGRGGDELLSPFPSFDERRVAAAEGGAYGSTTS